MATNDIPVAPFYPGWGTYQQLLVSAVTPLTEEQLQLRPAPHMWSVSILLRHIIGARVGWFHGWMGEGDASLETFEGWDDEVDARPTASELVQGLATTWQMIDAALQRWTTADMGQAFPNPWRADRPERSRQWIIWHVLEHDLHHGGEVSLILGANGVAALDL